MHLVIGIGQPRDLDFAIVTSRDEIPADAQVFAIFSGTYAFEQINEETFDAMTDGEYYTLRALAQRARELEAQSRQAATTARTESLLSRFHQWLLSVSADMRSA